EKDIRNYKTYDIPSTVDSRPDISQTKPSTRKISICLGIFSLLALLVLSFYNFGDYDDVTRIPKRYQLFRDNYDSFDYIIESSFFASKNNELTMIQDVKHADDVNSLTQNFNLNLNASSPNVTFSSMTYAIIKQIDRQLGKYQIQEFFYQNSVVYYDSPVTSGSYIKNTWPIIVEISFKASNKSLNPSAVEACNFRIVFVKKGFFNDFDGYIERRCSRAREYNFYLVSQVKGNTDSGLKFFQGENMFATVSNKSLNREMRNVVVEDGATFPSLIPALYAIYYDYLKMKRQARDITRIPNNYQLLRDKLNINNYEIQSTSIISPYNDINNTSSTIRAMIKAIKYPSGKYSVREFFYETSVENYPYTLITANSTIQDKWPAI
ncbi:3535_t:CDS:2, partial [Racocetra persica]